ncbi:hypothetical protein HZS_4725, partial [Henneguya salminicola]
KALQLELYPNQIYQSLLLKLREIYGSAPYPIPGKSAVYHTIREQRSSIFLNSIQAATLPPLRHLLNSQPFFRRYWSGDMDGEYHQMLIWCTNEELSLKRYNSHTFVDCTFRSTPAPFIQCQIVMVNDAGTQMFVPCVYSLITSESEYMYLTNLLFLLSIAIERKLKKYKVSEHNCRIILSKIELLTIVLIQEIPIAIRYVNSLTTVQPELISFWSCFDLTWRRRFEPQLWNISNMNDIDIAGRTKNALERYNRRIGENFADAHPNLPSFISIIGSEFQFYSERCTEIKKNSGGIVYQSERVSMPNLTYAIYHGSKTKLKSLFFIKIICKLKFYYTRAPKIGSN